MMVADGADVAAAGVKQVASGTLVAGLLAQSGGFFVQMSNGEEDKRSFGTTLTSLVAVVRVYDRLFQNA